MPKNQANNTKKVWLYGLCLSIWGCVAQGQTIVPSDSLYWYASKNQEVLVCERVASTFVAKSNAVFINFGKDYPEQTFVGVIFAKSLLSFPYDPAERFKDQFICLQGKVKMYRGIPEIIISSPTQIQSPKEVLKKRTG